MHNFILEFKLNISLKIFLIYLFQPFEPEILGKYQFTLEGKFTWNVYVKIRNYKNSFI